jgi:hypothetical protein
MTIYKKLSVIQEAFKAPKSEFNTHGGFKYRSLEPMLKELKPILKEHNCMIMFNDRLESCADTPHIVAEAILVDLDSDNTVIASASAQEAAIQKGMQAAQISGSTSSYARKYALAGLLAVDDEADLDSKDGNSQNSRVSKGGELKASPNKPASPAQKKFLNELYQQTHPDGDVLEFIEEEGVIAKEMTSEQASHLIGLLKD